MEIQEKSPVLQQREQTILVAMTEAVEKMENLSMISTLCHHFTFAAASKAQVAESSTSSSNVRKWALDRREAKATGLNIALQELASCQKNVRNSKAAQIYNEQLGYKVELTQGHQFGDNGAAHNMQLVQKEDFRERLKKREDKRKFLREIMSRVKGNVLPVDEAGEPLSAVNLLRDALQSKYRLHVRRCFDDLDVEGLVNILYLICSAEGGLSAQSENPLDGTTAISSHSSISARDFTVGENGQMESFYCLESPLSSSSSTTLTSEPSIFWDNEETVIDFEEGDDDDMTSELDEQSAIAGAVGQLGNQWQLKLDKIREMGNTFRNSFSNYEKVGWPALELVSELDVINCYNKFLTVVGKQNMANVARQLISTIFPEKDCIPLKMDINVDRVAEALCQLQTLAHQLFTTSHQRGGVIKGVNKLTVTYRLLSNENERLQKILDELTTQCEAQRTGLDDSVREWEQNVANMKQAVNHSLKSSIRNHATAELSVVKGQKEELEKLAVNLGTANESLTQTRKFVSKSVKSLRARRHYLEASLESTIRHYNSTMLKYQRKIDELCVEEVANGKEVDRLQNKFKDVEEKYDEMRAMKRLKELLANMEKAEAIKQNWAARKIQMAWRKYKVAKLRKKKLKGRKRGKKKTPPPPGKGGTPPTKSSTPGSRSKSQTP